MTMKIKRVLALMIALMLAMPTFTFAEDDVMTIETVAEGIPSAAEEPDVSGDDEVVSEVETLEIEAPGEEPEAQAPRAFAQTVTLDGIAIALTAQPGAFPAGAALRAEK